MRHWFDTPVVPTETRASELSFPRRAPTQVWMILTFAFLLGIAMIVVAVYAFPVLNQQITGEARRALEEQAQRALDEIDRAETQEEIGELISHLSNLSGHRVTLVGEGQLMYDAEGGRAVEPDNQPDRVAIEQAMTGGKGFSQEVDPTTGMLTLRVALASETGRVVQLEQVDPPVYRMLRPMQIALLTSMALALVLALIGSWIASIRITNPLQALMSTAKRINSGELDKDIAVQSRASEFQDLSETLDDMAEHFRDDIKQLQRLIRIQNEFLGNVSHEVRNPIFAINGYLEALGSEHMNPERRARYVQKGLSNLDRLNTLFSDLVEIARLEYREDLIQHEVFDLQDLIEEVVETARIKAEAKALELEVRNPHYYAVADRNRIAQVLTNLIENAIAYTDEGRIRCRLTRRGDKIRVEVQDSGKGIGPEHVERIFDRFYRVDTARSRKHGGSGLGLSIVRQILHAHGEAIHIHSTPGKGSTFWFELPFISKKEAEALIHASDEETASLALPEVEIE